MAKGTHDYDHDPRNATVLINVNGELFPRDRAVVSVLDSGFVMGDGVWEGLRLHHCKLAFVEDHLRRLYEGAKAIDLEIGLSPDELVQRIDDTVAANQMTDGVHIRVMVSRGVKSTPYQDPRVAVSPPTIVIIPEYKTVLPETVQQGIRLFTVHVRRGYPDTLDPKLNSHSKLNCITACIQAAKAGYDEALMLDPHGFVATCNSTHFFIIREGQVWTSTGDFCLGGITRKNVIRICEDHGIPCLQKNFSLTEVYSACEAFVTGTFAGLVHVTEVDGRRLGVHETAKNGAGPMVQRLQKLYADLITADCSS